MKKSSLMDRMKAGVASPDRFAAAEAAMASGGLPSVATLAQQSKLQVDDKALPTKEQSAQFLAGSRVTEKSTTGESSIIRETFSLPPADSALIDQIRQRVAAQGVMLNRSEVLRAGLAALRTMDEPALAQIGAAVPKMKTGRPKSG